MIVIVKRFHEERFKVWLPDGDKGFVSDAEAKIKIMGLDPISTRDYSTYEILKEEAHAV